MKTEVRVSVGGVVAYVAGIDERHLREHLEFPGVSFKGVDLTRCCEAIVVEGVGEEIRSLVEVAKTFCSTKILVWKYILSHGYGAGILIPDDADLSLATFYDHDDHLVKSQTNQ